MKSLAASTEAARRNERVFFITEPSARKGSFPKSNYECFQASTGETVRATMVVERLLNPWKVEKFTSPDCSVVAIMIDGRQVYLCSCYLDITKDVHQPELISVSKHCNRYRIPLVIGADTNAHSMLWGCDEMNSRGSDLEELMLSLHLNVLNLGSESTFMSSRADSIIDVTMVNATAITLLDLEDWRVDKSMSASDHRYLLFSIGRFTPKGELVRNLKRADWETFRSILDQAELPGEPTSAEGLDAGALALEQCILNALDGVAPLRPALHLRGHSWWTDELEQIRQELLVLYNRRGKYGMEAYRNLRRLYCRKLRRAKRTSWQAFVSKAESAKEVSRIINILKPSTSKGISLFNDNGEPLDAERTLKVLMDTHFIDSRSLQSGEKRVGPYTTKIIYDEGTKRFVEYITAAKVEEALRSFGPAKAAGSDGFKPVVLQNLSCGTYEYLTRIYKWAVLLGHVPKPWLTMKVVFIPKPGKQSYGEAKSYRPITLSNFLLKGLERLVQWYITSEIIPQPLYAQHAYTADRSCDTALSEVWDTIERSVLQGEYALAVSLDCSGAFDRIKFASADKAMALHDIPTGIRAMYSHMLECREVTAELQGEKCVRNPRRGSPQGGVLSPLIWVLIMNEILERFRDSCTKVVGYANDLIIICRGKVPLTLIEEMESALEAVLSWGEKNGLIFNPSKTSCVRFSLSKRHSKWRKVKMAGRELPYEESMKYLGVTLHRSMGFSKHLSEKVATASKILSLAKSVIGQQWGLSMEKLLWVYQAMVKPIVLYGCLTWVSSMTETMRKKLEKLQRKALLCLTASMRSTPTAGMEVVLGLPPLDLEAEREATASLLRTKLTLSESWDGVGRGKRIGHRRYLDNTLRRCKIDLLPLDRVRRERISVGGNDEVTLPDLTLYTDGSKMEGVAGCGWAACHGDSIVWEDHTYLGRHASVFQAEVTAIEQAIRWASSNCDEGTNILIRSDSQAAIQAILGTESRSKVVLSCIRYFRKAKENLRISLQWVRGHNDNTGNELADFLAREGSSMRCDSVEPELPLPRSAIKSAIRRHFLAKWQKRWYASDSCQATKLFFPRVRTGKVRKLAKWHRSRINLLIQCGTGHALVAHHLSKWKQIEDRCALCLEGEESIAHLFFDCTALWRSITERNIVGSRELAGGPQVTADLTAELKLVNFFSQERLRMLFSKSADELERS